jgi:hypothetical protein
MLLACASLSVFAACGDDSDGDAGTAGGGGAAGVTGGAGGTTAGAGGAKAGTGGGAAGALSCGGTMCMVNPILKMINPAAQACCTSNMKCGQYNTAMKCLEYSTVKPPADPSCPTVTAVVGGMNYPNTGCCTADKKCGADYSMVGWGCVERTNIDSAMGNMAPYAALACGANGADGGGDAGL